MCRPLCAIPTRKQRVKCATNWTVHRTFSGCPSETAGSDAFQNELALVYYNTHAYPVWGYPVSVEAKLVLIENNRK